MKHSLTHVSINLFTQLQNLIKDLTDEMYSMPLQVLSGNTLAKHIRHILELYEEMVKGVHAGTINYDARKRNLLLEHNREFTLQFIEELKNNIAVLTDDKPIILEAVFDNEKNTLQTSVQREMAYNIEHAIHHMAILQIAIKHQFPQIKLPEQFGIAYSTQAYLKQNVHA
ncbi:MAG: DinB family protein [Bacteroidia bacterium]|jgi:hypothetical protein|nr:DinB family protein [Bacteroidia bacterium]